MAELMKGKPVADAIGERLAPRIAQLAARNVVPTLAVVRVGERDDDMAYERGIVKRFEALGLGLRRVVLPADCTQRDLEETIGRVNADDAVHGCLLFRPLPAHLDEAAACSAIDPTKDVDGVSEGSLYGVFSGQGRGFPPCTADACMQVLGHYGCELDGAKVTVVGRSLVIGRPVSMMLQAANATVTMCHTHTHDLGEACRQADILVVAAGHVGTVGGAAVRPGQVVVDVGVNWDADAGRLVGDVAFDEVETIVAAITPVPGGVGSVTTAVLAEHVVEAAQR